MTTSVFMMVIAAAFLHATWNTLVKNTADRLVMIGIIMVRSQNGFFTGPVDPVNDQTMTTQMLI